MSDLKDFADQLQQEVVSDMAESFFGARKDLDDALEAFSTMVQEFLPTVEKLYRAAATLRMLLVDEQGVDSFTADLGLEPDAILPAEGAPVLLPESVPFALTARGRWFKCLCLAWEQYQSLADEYIHGRYYDDPQMQGRKRITIHYNRLVEFARLINEDIRKINTENSTTAVLRRFRDMDPEQVERENILGEACLVEGCDLDRDMHYRPIDFLGYHLPEVCELPPLNKVRGRIRRFSRKRYEGRREGVALAIKALRGQ